MQQFIAKFGNLIEGVISGADRLVLRGSLRAIQYQFGMMGYLWHKQVALTGLASTRNGSPSRSKRRRWRKPVGCAGQCG
jgi:hypothetical protein